MLSLVVRKEIHDNILNVRFAAAFTVSLVLIVGSLALLARSHEEEVRDYLSRVQQQDDFIDRFGHLNRLGWMSLQQREPPHLQVLVLGIDREAGQANFISNPLPVLLSRLDFASIVTIIMSLIAILFSYDAITGEREAGLLRQVLAAGASRRTLLIGKYLGGLVSLIIPFTFSVLAGMLLLALNPGVQLQPVDFAVFSVVLLLSWLYVAAFYGLGLLFSARSRTSAEAILKSLFAWVALVLVIPNISPFVVAQIYPIPSAAKIAQERYMIVDRERDEIIRDRRRQLIESKYADLKAIVDLPQNAIEEKLGADLSLKERYREFAHEEDEMVGIVNKEQQAKADKVSELFQRRLEYQEKLAGIVTSASPFSNFVFVATDLAETGNASGDRWEKEAEEYRNTLEQYAGAKYNKEKEKNPAFDFNDYLDLRNRPRFRYMTAPLGDRTEPDLPQWGVLIAFNLIIFTGSFVSFQRYDVR